MRNTAALKSIEALYKEAETVIGDGVPMVAIVKSAPPAAKPDIPVATRAIPAADTPIADTPTADNSQLDPSISGANHTAEAQTAVFDRIEMLRSMAASLDDDPATDTGSAPATDPAAALPNAALPSAALPSAALPNAPPVPAYEAGSRQISDAELEDVVKKAVDDIVAVTPLDSVIAGNDRIESVMADIAEAVGKAEPADMPDAPDLHDASDMSDPEAITSDITATPAEAPIESSDESSPTSAAPVKSTTSIDLENLNDIVASTVKSVIREELSNLVQSTVKSTLDELRTARGDQTDGTSSDR
jgi:hypothetical protein